VGLPTFQGSVPVDPHANHTLATLLRTGVPLTRQFQTRGGPVTLGELLASLKREFRYAPSRSCSASTPGRSTRSPR